MGVDMSALRPRVEVPAGFVPDAERWYGDDPWYFHLNWTGMARMAEEMDRAGVLDLETSHAPWPKCPGPYERHFEELDDRDEFGHAERPLTDEAAAYLGQHDEILRTLGEHGKVPIFKFGSNDGWIVTAVECCWIADALDQRALLLEGTWQERVEQFATFSRRCAERADGYAVW